MKWQVGIDTGSYYVKVVEGTEKDGRLIIKRIGFFSNPFPELQKNQNEREQDAFVKALKNFLQEHRITTKRGILSTGGNGTIIHYFDIPELPEQEIEPVVQLEMMQVVPGGIKNLEYDYTILTGKSNKKTLLFVGCPEEKCEFLVSTAQMAGINPLIMDYDGLAVLRSFRFLHKKTEDIVFILNIGYKTTNLVLAEKDNFIFIRDIPFGDKNITDIVASDKKISTAEAEMYSKKEENKEEMKKMVSTEISDFITEVRTSIEYFKRRTDQSPQILFLTGGGALFPGLCDSFEKDINIKTDIWNPLKELATEISIPLDLQNKGVIFTASLGLISREIK